MRRRSILALPLLGPPLLAPLALSLPALAQPRAIRVIVPFGAGGIIDVAARLMAEPMGAELGQTLLIENQPGAGATIGARNVARAAADGQTLLVSGAAHAVMPALYNDAPDPARDFTPITLISQQPFLLAVHPSNPARDLPGFLGWLREKRDTATFGTTGIGAASHLAGELLKKLAGVDFTVVPYRGTPQAVTDLTAGRLDFMIDSQTLLAPLARAGQVIGLAVTTPTRSVMLPDLPSIADVVPGFDSSSWQGMYAPAGLPAPLAARLAAAAAVALARPELQRRFAEAGLQMMAPGPDALARFLAAETARWVPILQATGARGG
ncbi:tripartite tricarboxylate transporter substrate-binding protein [Sediminicoccus sp. KRV36]|uniref:tripartite tricarboxylate transporter substrate-binding protein n=1 Tax=Sediminicoccus sp. KRV36 TaxID=3133721 RepID=UPI00200CC8ED|nr:tripartite tricarboxylate transporter substrate-binding protein [Sediminicoccus rosea]UPY37022.1 tripartite tricarboxylate transporter substrate binding protein [Sediminicoccus rosea]